MEESAERQFKIQLCKLTAKLQYLCGVVNMFTPGYAQIEHGKEHQNIRFEFAKSKAHWQTRYKEVTGDYVHFWDYYKLGDEALENNRKGNQKLILKLKEAIRVLEAFIESPKDFDFEQEFNWYTETIKFKVFELEYARER